MKELILSPFVSDGMIIQRDAPFPVWSKIKITISFLGKTYEANQKDGKWLVTLDPVKSGGPFEMKIKLDKKTIKIKDIYSGDVWLCSGQSNMELMMQRLRDNYSEEWDCFKNKNKKEKSGSSSSLIIRQFKAAQEFDFSCERDDLTSGSWLCASKENLHEFSGTAWFFARKMFEKYGVPIGLVMTAWGGTPIESWMSEEALLEFPQKIAEGRLYASKAKRDEITASVSKAINDWENEVKRLDLGIAQKWENMDTDISSWKEINLPGDFSDFAQNDHDLDNFCGVIWLSKDFEILNKSSCKNAKVWLGTIVDADSVYLNGAYIGSTGYRYPPRKYAASKLLKNGKNRIVIRVTCNNGQGGVTKDKPFNIFSDNETVELKGAWKYKIGFKADTRPGEFFFQRMAMGNFNAMIYPLLKYPLKGVLWYQGESNDSNANEYAKLLKLMIEDWRKKYSRMSNNILPFILVQLPIWKEASDNNEEHHWAILREAQMQALSLDKTAIAAALDLGEWNDLHPLNKKDVGYRLFLAADKTIFKEENTSPGPMVVKHEIKNNKIEIYFNNCGGGLIQSCPFVTVICENERFRLPVTISEKDCIIIDVSKAGNIKTILYAWADNPRDRQLFNSDGLPALPFKLEIKPE